MRTFRRAYTQMAMHDGLSRRQLIGAAVTLGGGIVLAGAMKTLLAQNGAREPTPGQIRGPFYPTVRPLDRDTDLTIFNGRSQRAQGKVIHVAGKIMNRNGDPVRGARVELWQANAHGRYAHTNDPNPAPLDPNFQGYGVQVTDEDGRYHFRTIKPGPYPSGGILRPPHIHFQIKGRNDDLVTQLYFPGEPLNEKDAIFNELGAAKDAVTAKILERDELIEPDALLLGWDVVLAEG